MLSAAASAYIGALAGALVFVIFERLYYRWKVQTDQAAYKTDNGNHFRALYGRMEKAESDLKKNEQAVQSVRTVDYADIKLQLNQIENGIKMGLTAGDNKTTRIQDDLFSLKSTVEALGQQISKKKKTKRSKRKR